jgi:hypothetical protein
MFRQFGKLDGEDRGTIVRLVGGLVETWYRRGPVDPLLRGRPHLWPGRMANRMVVTKLPVAR